MSWAMSREDYLLLTIMRTDKIHMHTISCLLIDDMLKKKFASLFIITIRISYSV